MKLVNLAFALMLLFSSVIANAVPEDVTTGSYKVLFDMGLSQTSYGISIDDPKDSETITGIPKTDHMINIRNKKGNSWAAISISKYRNPNPQPFINQPADVLDSILKNNYPGYSIDTGSRIIDGGNGSVGWVSKGQVMKFDAVYVAPFDPNLIIYIQSTFPWDEGSRQLIDTIHIEETSNQTRNLPNSMGSKIADTNISIPQPSLSFASPTSEVSTPKNKEQSTSDSYTSSYSGSNCDPVYVDGYYRKDGTYVRPHYRSAPGCG